MWVYDGLCGFRVAMSLWGQEWMVSDPNVSKLAGLVAYSFNNFGAVVCCSVNRRVGET